MSVGYFYICNNCFHEPVEPETPDNNFGIELVRKVLCRPVCKVCLHGGGTQQQSSSQRRKQQGEENDQYYINRFFDTFVA